MIRSRRTMRLIRHKRLRKKVRGTPERPRAAFYKSLRHVYCQVIDDTVGKTLVSASSIDRDLRKELEGKPFREKVVAVAEKLAEKLHSAGITTVVFDRGGFKYHGNVKLFADTLREKGIKL